MSEFNPLPIQASVPGAGAEPGPEGTDSSGSETAGDTRFAEVLAKQADAFAPLGTSIPHADLPRVVESPANSGGKQLPFPTGLLLPIRSANGMEPLGALALQSNPGRASLEAQELGNRAPVIPDGQTGSGQKFDLKLMSTAIAQLLTPEHRNSGRAEGMAVQSSLSGEFTPLIANGSHSPLSSDILELKPPIRLSIPVPTSGPDWGTAFSNRVAWMVNRNVQIAELQLYPPELGRVEVRISLQNGTADIHFGAQHVTAREAIESALPKLRETLSESGLADVTLDVSRHTLSNGSGGGFQNARNQSIADTPLSDVPTGEERTHEIAFRTHDGLIDHYA